MLRSRKSTQCGLKIQAEAFQRNFFEKIFNPFFTTKHSRTGLRLSICSKNIESHGGTIRVENQLGKGVTVYLHLPLQNSPD
jgi:signal transduction histidine kinase